jgi:hypothetical protein
MNLKAYSFQMDYLTLSNKIIIRMPVGFFNRFMQYRNWGKKRTSRQLRDVHFGMTGAYFLAFTPGAFATGRFPVALRLS